jgi:hypothetical protein
MAGEPLKVTARHNAKTILSKLESLKMSLIQQIKSKAFTDLINEGARLALTGTLGSGTDQVIYSMPASRFFIVAGYSISSGSVTSVEVRLAIKKGTDPAMEFFRGHVGAGMPISRDLSFGNMLYGDLGYSLVASSDGTFSYTIDGRLSSGLTPLGYIQQIGSKEHNNPYFGPESGKDRGQMEL